MRKILMVTESMGAGVLSSIENTCHFLKRDFLITVLYSSRVETPSEMELKNRFGSDVELIEIKTLPGLKLMALFFYYYYVIKKTNPDTIHFHSSYAGFIGRLIVFLFYSKRNFKVFYSPHCFGFMRQDISKWKKSFFYFLEKIATFLPGELIAVSQYERSLAQSIGYRNTHCVYNTLIETEENTDRLVKDDNGIIIGSIGRLSIQKDPFLFIEVAKRIIKTYPNVSFVWIGGGELENIVSDHLKKENLLQKVKVSGWIDRGEVLKQLQTVDIYLHTANWEALPISILEAMRNNKPLVVREFPGVNELVFEGKNGYINTTLDQLVLSVEKLIIDRNLRINMGSSSHRIFKEVFDPSVTIMQLKKIYNL